MAGRAILMDMASTLFFVAVYAASSNLALAVSLGMALALAQIGWRLANHAAVDALQWISLAIIAAGGTAALLTHNPLFVMLKPTAIYLVVGAAMLRPGWMNPYMPPRAVQAVPDLIVIFGHVWAGLMFFSAAVNLALALTFSVAAWGTAMTIWGIASKTALFFAQYGVMKTIGRRRVLRGQVILAPAI